MPTINGRNIPRRKCLFSEDGSPIRRKARGFSLYKKAHPSNQHRASGSFWPTAYAGTPNKPTAKVPAKRKPAKRWS